MFEALGGRRSAAGGNSPVPPHRAGFIEDALGAPDRVASLAALFPDLAFESLGNSWPEQIPPGLDIAIVSVDGASAAELDRAVVLLNRTSRSTRILVVLRNADVVNTRRMVREGAADVLTAPVSEPALALSVERLLKVAAQPCRQVSRDSWWQF